MKHFLRKIYKRWNKLLPGNFSKFLSALLLLFIFRPYGRGIVYQIIWEFVFVLVVLTAIFNCNHTKKLKITTIIFGFPAVLLEWILFFYPKEPLQIAFLLFVIPFIFVTTYSIIKQVIINARVTLDTLKGVICAFFMLSFGFSFLYYLIELIAPGSLKFLIFDIANDHTHFLSQLMYFSFVTLLCIGYGDIIAISDIAQTTSILEAIIGQFYIAILVARLVAVYSFFEHKLHLQFHKHQRKEEK